ncbi:MAG: hypothetical protein R3D66_01390 [Alphaproteobacteria bacterium]
MLDWSFNDFECLPLLASLLLNEEMSKDESSLDDLYNADEEQLLSDLCKSKESHDLLNSILGGIKNGDLVTDKDYSDSKLRVSNSHNIYIEPVSFFRWAEKQGHSVTYHIRSNVDSRERELRIELYEDYKISLETVHERMREPLWLVAVAILYLHGFEPTNKQRNQYGRPDPNDQIIRSNSQMKKVQEYLYDSAKLGEIEVFHRSGYKVKPQDFMNWASNLGLSFPNLVSNKKKSKDKPLSTLERETLLKLVIGMAVDGYGYDPVAKRSPLAKELEDSLNELGISITDDTIRKWLKESAELLPQAPENTEN